MDRISHTRRGRVRSRWVDVREARIARTLDPVVAEDDYFRFANRGR